MVDMHLLSFAGLLKLCRIRLRYTQREFATFLEVPVTTYKSWEYGKALPLPERFQALIDYLENALDEKDKRVIDNLILSNLILRYEEGKIKGKNGVIINGRYKKVGS